MIFFAESLPDPSSYAEIGLGVAVITALCICANQAVALWRNLQPRPPMDQQLREALIIVEQKFATKNEVDRLESGITERITAVEHDVGKTDEYVRHLEMRLFDRIDLILDKVDKRLDLAYQRIDSLNGQIRYIEGKSASGRIHPEGK